MGRLCPICDKEVSISDMMAHVRRKHPGHEEEVRAYFAEEREEREDTPGEVSVWRGRRVGPRRGDY